MNENLDIRKTKVYCCENILFNLIELIRKNNLSAIDIEEINKVLKEDILPYFFKKYPLSEEKNYISLDVKETNTMLDNENDLLFKSKVKFRYSETKNYNSEIMKFLNYLITLTNCEIEDQKTQKSKRSDDDFFQTIEGIFEKIYDPTQIQRFSRFVKKTAKVFMNDLEEYQNVEYERKVKSYSNFEFGAKLPESIKQFTEKEIAEGNININSPELIRLVCKWCSEL